MPIKAGLFRRAGLLIQHIGHQRFAGKAIEQRGLVIGFFDIPLRSIWIVRHA